MDVVDVLVKARARIVDPGRWCQNASSRNARGEFVPGNRAESVQVCLGYAIFSAASDEDLLEAACGAFARTIGQVDPIVGIVKFNDANSHDVVLAALDKTIATERAKRSTEKLIDAALHSPASAIEPPPVYTVERVW